MPNPVRPQSMPALGTIVLAGGRSSRMGHPKAALRRAGRSLLSEVVSAAGVLGPVVVVAPPDLAETTLDAAARAHVGAVTCEDPPHGGPVAGIAAGLGALPAGIDEVVVLACDLPHAADLAAALGSGRLDGAQVLAPVDDEGFVQHLAARYEVAALQDAVAALPTTRDVSVRRLVGGLAVRRLAVDPEALADVDDPPAAARHGLCRARGCAGRGRRGSCA